MTLFAGIWNLTDKAVTTGLPSLTKRELVDVWSRGPDLPRTYECPRLYLTTVDVGAFGCTGVRKSHEALTAVAGETLLKPIMAEAPSRDCDLACLAPLLTANGPIALRACRGTFALCHYDRIADTLLVATDRLGVRPLYYHIGANQLYFATALRALEALTTIPKKLDMHGLTEETVLGFALSDRTPYADIKVLQSGECLQCIDGRVILSTYFRLDEVEPTTLPYDAFLDAAYERFRTAVAIRASRESTARSFLSGGLDSRCVVVALKELQKSVSTITFEVPPSPDRTIADQFAAIIGSHHIVQRGQSGVAPHELLKFQADRRSWLSEQATKYPQLVFSGDGGSVGVGYVYMNDQIVQYLRQGQTKRAVREYLGNHRLPRKIFKPEVYNRLDDVVFDGVLEELNRITTSDPAKAFYLFLMKNDQRRHLYQYVYEDIDIRRVEFLMPFYDGDFIELIASAPVNWLLHHAFYHQWLTRFPKVAMKLPWQTYPGHLPCPVTGLSIERTQWDRSRQERRKAMFTRLVQCGAALREPSFPSSIMRRSAVWLAYLAQWLGIRNCESSIDTFVSFHRYFNRCGGNLAFPAKEHLNRDPIFERSHQKHSSSVQPNAIHSEGVGRL